MGRARMQSLLVIYVSLCIADFVGRMVSIVSKNRPWTYMKTEISLKLLFITTKLPGNVVQLFSGCCRLQASSQAYQARTGPNIGSVRELSFS